MFFFFKQKTAYELRISDWSSDVCSSDLATGSVSGNSFVGGLVGLQTVGSISQSYATGSVTGGFATGGLVGLQDGGSSISQSYATGSVPGGFYTGGLVGQSSGSSISRSFATRSRSGEHTTELPSLMRNHYAVSGVKKKI